MSPKHYKRVKTPKCTHNASQMPALIFLLKKLNQTHTHARDKKTLQTKQTNNSCRNTKGSSHSTRGKKKQQRTMFDLSTTGTQINNEKT